MNNIEDAEMILNTKSFALAFGLTVGLISNTADAADSIVLCESLDGLRVAKFNQNAEENNLIMQTSIDRRTATEPYITTTIKDISAEQAIEEADKYCAIGYEDKLGF